MGSGAGGRARRAPRPSRSPIIVVWISVLFGLVALAAETRQVWYLNDASVHASMVRWAAERIREGHLPFDGWYPYLALGASRFHHYQSLPHVLTGLLSVAFGPATFRWSLYLLVASWPVSVYVGGRLLGLGRWPSAGAAAVAPLLASAPGLGFEWGSYVWRGSGTWAQLWGMWALPLAWGLSWRAVAEGRRLWLAGLAVGITVCLHLLTGYLALLTLGVWVLLRPRQLRIRLGRAALVGVGALAAAAWMLVPLIVDASWTVNDEFSRGQIYYDSFGARRILTWLVTGGLFDHERFPSISLLVLAGLIVALTAARRREAPRAVLGAGILSMLLFFGRPTLGPLLDLLPGGEDLFFRRFISGVHLAGLYLSGLGLTWLVGTLRLGFRKLRPSALPVRAAAAAGVIAVMLLGPALVERAGFAWRGATWIGEQQEAERTDGVAFVALVERARQDGPGRIFVGHRSAGRASPRIGFTPLYTIPLSLDADSVGFTRPTWSLISPSEYRFDGDDPALRRLFGIRYVIRDRSSPVPDGATELARAGGFRLYQLEGPSYVTIVDTIAAVAADRRNLGQQMSSILRSGLPELGMLPTLAFGGRAAAAPTLEPNQLPIGPPGQVLESDARPADGEFGAEVDLERPAVVLASASFDPRWTAFVDGRAAEPQMVAPALVGVIVPPGRHQVSFRYRPYAAYGPLFVLGAVVVGSLGFAEQVVRKRRKPPARS